jgi:hypothetical protein
VLERGQADDAHQLADELMIWLPPNFTLAENKGAARQRRRVQRPRARLASGGRGRRPLIGPIAKNII